MPKKYQKKEENTVTIYECDYCKKEHFCLADVLHCEKQHVCNHEGLYFFKTVSDDAWRYNVEGIRLICEHCNKVLDSVYFEDIEDNQKILKIIFETMKKQLSAEKML